MFCSCNRKEKLTIYEFDYSDIKMSYGKLPSTSDERIVFTCAAAFTATLSEEFSYSNINGIVISDGKSHNLPFKGNYGMFAFINNKPYFTEKASDELVRKAKKHKGTLFQQYPIIINSKRCKVKGPNELYQFRALCEKNGRLFIAEASRSMKYTKFVELLQKKEVQNAIYLDVGYGWDRAWYRNKRGKVKWINYFHFSNYPTNFVTFYK